MWQRLRWDLTQHSRAAHFMEAVARLSPGTTFEQAQSAVDALGVRMQTEFARTNKGWNARLMPLLDEELGYYRPALMVLFGAVALLLVIGVLNVATLLLTRALVARKGNRGAGRARRSAAPAGHAADGREPGALGVRRGGRHSRHARGAAVDRRASLRSRFRGSRRPASTSAHWDCASAWSA